MLTSNLAEGRIHKRPMRALKLTHLYPFTEEYYMPKHFFNSLLLWSGNTLIIKRKIVQNTNIGISSSSMAFMPRGSYEQ
jgi:hypothetical protein